MSVFIYADDKAWDGVIIDTGALEIPVLYPSPTMLHRPMLNVYSDLHIDYG